MLLMHENIPVAEVSLYLGNITAVHKIINPEHLPVGTNHSGSLLCKYLNAWQKDRAIPFNRKSMDLYTSYFNTSTLAASQIGGSFSLTDHYWFKEKNSLDKWEDLCFQLNGFPNNFTTFFLNALENETFAGEQDLRIPDINTDGVLPKVWIQENGKFELIKFGDLNNMEGCNLLSANEVACSQIAQLMNINAVEYKKIFLNGLDGPICKCENFIPEDMEFITLSQIIKENAGKSFDIYSYIRELGYEKEIEDMIKLFFLIHNKDGHTKNIGFLRDAKTLQIKAFAPIFDLGCSLNYDGLGQSDQLVKPFKEDRLEQLQLIKNLGELPDFNSIAKIIKTVYQEFNIPDVQLDKALNDLIDTYKMFEKLKEIDKNHDEIDFEE